MRLYVRLIAVLLVISISAACKHASSGPSQTVKDFIEKINNNEVEAPIKLLSTHYLSGPGGANFARGMIVFSMGALHNAGGIKLVKPLSETISGDAAKVKVRLIYNSGKYEDLDYNLVKEKNEWKIDSF